jgi:hypothetical protein
VHSLGQGGNQAVFGGDAGRAVRIDLKPVRRIERPDRLRAGLPGTNQRCQLDEELIEPGRRDDFQQPRRAVSGVPERVPDIPGL